MKSIKDLLHEHPFFRGLPDEDLAVLAGCAWNESYAADQLLFEEGDEAKRFFLLREGAVALELHTRGRHTLQTLDAGDILGWAWLVPPHECKFDARAVTDVRVTAFDGVCLRGKCDQDPRLGYELMKRFVAVMMRRFEETRLQLIDVYGGAAPDTHVRP